MCDIHLYEYFELFSSITFPEVGWLSPRTWRLVFFCFFFLFKDSAKELSKKMGSIAARSVMYGRANSPLLSPSVENTFPSWCNKMSFYFVMKERLRERTIYSKHPDKGLQFTGYKLNTNKYWQNSTVDGELTEKPCSERNVSWLLWNLGKGNSTWNTSLKSKEKKGRWRGHGSYRHKQEHRGL